MIENVRPIPTGFYPPKIEGAEEEVRQMTYTKLNELYGENVPEHLKERIEKELEFNNRKWICSSLPYSPEAC